MNFNKLVRGIATLCAGAILLVSCQKENETIHTEVTDLNSASGKLSGVVPDDPALVAKIPVIASSDFLENKISNYFSTQPQIESAKGNGGRDRTSPSVTITSPGSGAVVSGTVGVQVAASDNIAVTSVVLTADGNVVGTSSTAPYTFSWNTTGLSSGTHTLTATATDAAGNSKTHTIQVGYNTASGADITPPSVSITSPANGASVTSTVTVSAAASDNVGVTGVSFKVDGATLSTDNSAPYSFSWNTSTVSAGIHTIAVSATDAAGNAASSTIQVTVNTTVITTPSLPGSVHLVMPAVQQQGGEGSCVSFAVGYAARSAEQFYKSNATSYSQATNVFSPEFLYNQTKSSSSCSSGSSLLAALEFMKSNGICTWQSMPYSYSDGCSLLPSTSQTAEAASFKISSYSAVYTSDLTAIKTMLVNKKPLVIMFALDPSFYNAGPGFVWSSYTSTNGALHAVTICGYDDAKQAVKVINSWGTAWGDAGYSWIDYNFLRTVTSQAVVMNL